MSDLSDSDSSLGEDEVVFTVQEVLRTGLSILHYTKKKIRRQNVPQIVPDSRVTIRLDEYPIPVCLSISVCKVASR
jgi:hypothetical protein